MIHPSKISIVIVYISLFLAFSFTWKNYHTEFKVSTAQAGKLSPPKNLKFQFFKSEVLPPIQVSPSNINVFSTPIGYYNGALYTVNVEPPAEVQNGMNLKTVIRKGIKSANGHWTWEVHSIDNTTIDDPYHNQASLAVDLHGYIHVAYNMHNMPWQYSVSSYPEDISKFEFRGDLVTNTQKFMVKFLNQTPFPTMGQAAIPGNQITYPAFYTDRQGELYLTYRYATKPARKFVDRGFAAGLVRYNVATKGWTPLGGTIPVSNADAQLRGKASSSLTSPLVFQKGWVAYLPKLAFDQNNRMHVTWMWRRGSPGPNLSHPSYAYSQDQGNTFFKSDKTKYTLPISNTDSESILKNGKSREFYSLTSFTVDPGGNPYIVLKPRDGKGAFLTTLDTSQRLWSKPEPTPYGASSFHIDKNGTQWAFARGIRIFRRSTQTNKKWERVLEEKGFCHPKFLEADETGGIFIHAQGCESPQVKIFWIRI